VSGLIREMAFGDSGHIREVAFGEWAYKRDGLW
jgi:hypothetical protein